MLKNYFTSAYRNLIRHKIFSFLNILGLAIGMAACLLILRYVSFELSYDGFHENIGELNRLYFERYRADEYQGRSLHTSYQLGPTLVGEVPEIQQFARWHPRYGGGVVTYYKEDGGLAQFAEQGINYVDTSFLEDFSFPLLKGNPKTALSAPKNIVLTESMVLKYFGQGVDPMGKTLQVDGGWSRGDYQVTGVVKDVPANSHLEFDFLLPMIDVLANDQYANDDGWGWTNFITYVRLIPNADTTAVLEKIATVYDRIHGERLQSENRQVFVKLQAVNKIHLHSAPNGTPSKEGKADSLYFFVLIGIFILLIAYVNYINLSTARAMIRAREVGIRKTVGAMRGQLIKQFLLESLLVNLIAVVLAVGMAQLLMPVLSDLLGKDLSLTYQDNSMFWFSLIALFLGGAFLSGLYPAFVLSGFRPVSVLKGLNEKLSYGISLRKALVVIQFAVSSFLIASTVAVYRQVDHMKSQDLGMNMDQILVVRGPQVLTEEEDEKIDQTIQTFKTEVLRNPRISHIASAGAVPGGGHNWGTGMRRMGVDRADNQFGSVVWVDYDFIETYDMKVLSGRPFSKDYGMDDEAVVINETAVRVFGLGDPQSALQEQLIVGGDTIRILAVMKDFAWTSMREEQSPFLLAPSEGQTRSFCARVSAEDMSETIAFIEEQFRQFFPNNPFEYSFQDEFFNEQYQDDQQFGSIFGLFTSLAILVACLGLFGLTLFSASRRIREIGIRKVLGASIQDLLTLLTRDFLLLVMGGVVLGLPLAYFYVEDWLEQYAVKIDIGILFFLLPMVIVLLIAMIAVSYQTLTSARSNPIDALRHE
ncbi:MAG: ABC transporter permease [Bacteroidota bacterium]